MQGSSESPMDVRTNKWIKSDREFNISGSLGGVNGNNGFALPLNGGSIQDDPFEEYEDDLSETAALTQTTISWYKTNYLAWIFISNFVIN